MGNIANKSKNIFFLCFLQLFLYKICEQGDKEMRRKNPCAFTTNCNHTVSNAKLLFFKSNEIFSKDSILWWKSRCSLLLKIRGCNSLALITSDHYHFRGGETVFYFPSAQRCFEFNTKNVLRFVFEWEGMGEVTLRYILYSSQFKMLSTNFL